MKHYTLCHSSRLGYDNYSIYVSADFLQIVLSLVTKPYFNGKGLFHFFLSNNFFIRRH